MRIYYMNLQAEKITGIGKVELLITITDKENQATISAGEMKCFIEIITLVNTVNNSEVL